jgi:hypothetical protein
MPALNYAKFRKLFFRPANLTGDESIIWCGDLVPGRLSVRSLFGRDSDLFRLEMTLAGPHFRSCPSSGCVRLGEAYRPGSLKSGNPLALLPPSYAWRRRDEIRTLYPTGTGRHRPRSPALRIAGRKMHLARNLPRHQSPARERGGPSRCGPVRRDLRRPAQCRLDRGAARASAVSSMDARTSSGCSRAG